MKAYPTSVTTAQHDSFIGEAKAWRNVRASIYDGARERDRTQHSGSERIMQVRAGTGSAELGPPLFALPFGPYSVRLNSVQRTVCCIDLCPR
jgi:hypothetical protein